MAAAQYAVGDDAAAAKKKELPKSGILSRSLDTGYQSKDVNLPWGYGEKDKVRDEDSGQPPITGSVSKVSERQWIMRVFNNSEDSYSVDLKVTQRDNRDTVLKTDSYSYNLKPGEKAERNISSYANTADAQLALVSWRKLSSAKKKEPAGDNARTQPVAGGLTK
jgi:hypothetical protein